MKHWAGVALLTLVALPAQATIVKQLSLAELSREADVIVHGAVTRQTSAWNATKDRIYTVTEIRVTEALKGEATPASVISVRQLGGTVDGLTQSIVGNAKLITGEEVIVFLDRDESKPLHYVVGMAQGKYSVDRSTPTPRVVRELHGLALAKLDGNRIAKLVEPAPTAAPPTLKSFKAEIRRALRPAP